MSDVRCVLKTASPLGETPVWSAAEGRLYWIDCPGAQVHRFDPASGGNERLSLGLEGYLGSIALVEDGGLLALCGKQLLRWRPGGAELELLAEVEPTTPENLPNDGKVDPDGRFWFGTMHRDSAKPTGALYSFMDGRLFEHDQAFSCANGLGWSPDGETFYFVDTMPGHILAYDFDRQHGRVARRRVFAKVDPAEGLPDGLCVDAEGGVWVAHWDGWCLSRFAPDGRRTDKVAMPVPRPTCPIFGGPNLETLFVTSAAEGLEPAVAEQAPLSGGLLAFEPAVPGLPLALARF